MLYIQFWISNNRHLIKREFKFIQRLPHHVQGTTTVLDTPHNCIDLHDEIVQQ